MAVHYTANSFANKTTIYTIPCGPFTFFQKILQGAFGPLNLMMFYKKDIYKNCHMINLAQVHLI